LNNSVHRGPQQIAVAVLGHPAGAGKVTIVDAPGAVRILVRIEPEQDANDRRPGTISLFELSDRRETLRAAWIGAG
jgi:hypothetical protein